ncbi:thiamine diphosphokinase [Candidatus Avelusimicrobium luingense]|uniref:thiamine diphosphokinase n=1 Tax=Candidatus Avelusimicrobium luingense TaxID=3416211 RepID=UPI003D0EAA9E
MEGLNHVLLIGNSPHCSLSLIKKLATTADFILATDGGANNARKAGIRPHAVIGDLDSVSRTTRHQWPDISWIFVDNQNNTDLQKALDYLVAHKCKKCTLIGFYGGRTDFSIGNLLALYSYAKKIDLCVMEDGWKIYPLCSEKTFSAPIGTRVSLLPLTTCYQVTLAGFKYPLKEARLTLGTTRTLSNLTAANRFSVSLTRGTLLVYIEHKSQR